MSATGWRTWEDFLQPRTTDVPRNRFGITDAAELERVERVHSLVRIAELGLSPIPGGFDLAHLQAIHRHIFGDVYEWAGIIRPFTLVKGGDEFCRPQFIESYAADVFGELREADLLRGLDDETFAAKAADLLTDMNALHPFREGNGRSQRAFLSQLAAQADNPLVWPPGAEQRNIDASRAAHRGDNGELRALIAEALRLSSSPPDKESDPPASSAQLAAQSFARPPGLVRPATSTTAVPNPSRRPKPPGAQL